MNQEQIKLMVVEKVANYKFTQAIADSKLMHFNRQLANVRFYSITPHAIAWMQNYAVPAHTHVDSMLFFVCNLFTLRGIRNVQIQLICCCFSLFLTLSAGSLDAFRSSKNECVCVHLAVENQFLNWFEMHFTRKGLLHIRDFSFTTYWTMKARRTHTNADQYIVA